MVDLSGELISRGLLFSPSKDLTGEDMLLLDLRDGCTDKGETELEDFTESEINRGKDLDE
jgi:hypothetical protein